MAFDSVSGQQIPPHIVDGNYVVASKHPRPWIKQLNLLAAYAYFFNPLRMLLALFWSLSRIPLADAETRPAEEIAQYSPLRKLGRRIFLKVRGHLLDAGVQALGMCGLFHTCRRTLAWAWKLSRGSIQHSTHAPASRLPMRSPDGGLASHALPGTSLASVPPQQVRLLSIDNGLHSKAA